MKKILFSLILLSSFVFGAVKDEGKVFKVEEVKALNDRINLLKEQTATDFEVVTLAEENEKVFSGLENATRKVIVVLQKGEENSKETWYTESDYYDVKRFLELKESVKKIFENPKRHEDLKVYITKKNKLKDEMTKISTDDWST